MPERIQLRRTKSWRKPEGAIVVARPSKWGNPFVVGATVELSGVQHGGLRYDSVTVTMTRELAVAAYRQLVLDRMDDFGDHEPENVAYVREWRAALAELRGHDLACWCPLDQPCHADVLLELANGAAE